MFRLLLEDNKNIEGYIKYLDSLILKLRTIKGIDEPTKQKLLSTYNEIISPWMKKYYLINKEISENEEMEMIDIILDNINMINKLLE